MNYSNITPIFYPWNNMKSFNSFYHPAVFYVLKIPRLVSVSKFLNGCCVPRKKNAALRQEIL